MSSLIWVGYNGPADVATKDHAARRFKLRDVLPDSEIARITAGLEGRLDELRAAIGDIELEVRTVLATENTNGATCANAWVGAPNKFAPAGTVHR